MKKLWSQLVGLPVLAVEENLLCGKLRAAFVHPETGKILAFLVGWSRVVTPREIRHYAEDRVEIGSVEDLVSPDEILRIKEYGLRRTLLTGKKILTRTANKIGTLRDFSFDPLTDHLTSIESSRSFLFWEWKQRSFPASDIQEITDRAIILNVDLEQKITQKEKVTEKATLSVAM